MIKIRITGRGSYVLQTAIARYLREVLGLSVSQWVDTSAGEVAGIAKKAEVREHEVLITIAEKEP